MQGKVSMVMTCYNKADYIGEMFDSIIAQDWDNIELILVNDGSTDGTREVISDYEPKFRERGFDVVVVDQENAGVCAAAKAGMERITGKYVCMVDADDELDPKYVSTMAGWLEANEQCDYCTCGSRMFTGSGDKKEYQPPWIPQVQIIKRNISTEDYLLCNVIWAIWAFMIRVEYFHRCRILETYYADTRGSHEPGFMLPLTAYAGKTKVFPQALYYHNRGVADSHSHHNTFERTVQHQNEYFDLVRRAVFMLPDEIADDSRKREIIRVSDFSRLRTIYNYALSFEEVEQTELIFCEILAFANDYFSLSRPITRRQTVSLENVFMQTIAKALIERRIIGYGAMGRVAAKLLPVLKGTAIEPTELWDINGDGVEVKKPDFDALDERDTVLVFPAGDIEESMRLQLCGVTFKVMYRADIINYIEDLFIRRFKGENHFNT